MIQLGEQNEQAEATGFTRQIGVPRAATRVLAACASAHRLCPDLPLNDAWAERAIDQLGGALTEFDEAELRCTAFRAFVLDNLARDFFARTPEGMGVGVSSLLGTRSHRLLDAPWIDVDSPDVARLRRFVLPPRRGWLQMGICACQPAWLSTICARSSRKLLLVLDESVLPMNANPLSRLLEDAATRLPTGSELLIAFDARAPLRPASPLRRSSAVELVVPDTSGNEEVARYPRLRFVDEDRYSAELRTQVAGVNAVATLYGGVGAPGFAHLQVV